MDGSAASLFSGARAVGAGILGWTAAQAMSGGSSHQGNED